VSSAVHLASRLDQVSVSAILALTARANALKSTGRDVILLTAGEPDFPTPSHIADAAVEAIRRGETRYTPITGTAALRAAICDKLARDNGLAYIPAEIIVSSGAKQVLFNVFAATVERGDEVIIPTPYWTSYPDIVRICGATPVFVQTSAVAGFKMRPGQLTQAIGQRTRWLMLNSPSNPAGVTYSADELGELAGVLQRHPHVGVISDEIYEHIRFQESCYPSIGAIAPWLRERLLIVNGVSKAYAMTGWRIGYGAGPTALVSAMETVQSQSTSGACSVAQAAALAALAGPQDLVGERTGRFRARRDLVVRMLADVPLLRCFNPSGAFYVYVDCSATIGRATADGVRLTDDVSLCKHMLDSAGIAVVPGSAFGYSPAFRLSVAASDEALAEACRRMSRFVGCLSTCA
jgi:aspartate aminotransferase